MSTSLLVIAYFALESTAQQIFIIENIKVAVIREEGTNGDREMVASLMRAGFEVWDVTMQDLLKNRAHLFQFRGLIFPGGFSYAGN